jgi:hypothetical protein
MNRTASIRPSGKPNQGRAPLARLLAVCAVACIGPATAPARANDYPTVDRADYVFACMASNGQTRQVLEQCACSIDVIASILPYERYVEASTILSVRQIGGEKGSLFRTGAQMKETVADLKRAQAEAEIRCF